MIFFLLFSLLMDKGHAYDRAHLISAESAILMEEQSGRVLFAKDMNKQMRIASITKIMTAIIAIESEKIDDDVKISQNAEGVEGSSIYLRSGEKMKLNDLVYGLMLKSGNDAAVAIAEHIGGSVDGFVLLMNEKAEQLGMTNTVFQNPHGLDDHEEHYSTAYDMAILTKYAMENEKFREVSATKSYRSDGEQVRVWNNKNRLLTELYPHSTGGKTGFTKRARRTLVSTAEKDEMGLIVVTLNAPSDWHDHISLFNWAFSSYEMEIIIEEGIQQNIKDSYYDSKLYTPYSFEYPLTQEEKEKIKRQVILYRPSNDENRENIAHDKAVGKIELSMNEKSIGQVPLYLKPIQEEEKKGFWRFISNLFSFGFR